MIPSAFLVPVSPPAPDEPVLLSEHLYSYDADVSPELRELGQRTMALAFLGWLMRSQTDLTARPVKGGGDGGGTRMTRTLATSAVHPGRPGIHAAESEPCHAGASPDDAMTAHAAPTAPPPRRSAEGGTGPLVVVESPYAGDVDRNLAYLRAALADCFARGEAPFASHGLYTQPGVLRDEVPEERAKGIAAGFLWGSVAPKRAFYLDYGWTPGMQAGLAEAFRLRQIIALRRLGGRWAQGKSRRRTTGRGTGW